MAENPQTPSPEAVAPDPDLQPPAIRQQVERLAASPYLVNSAQLCRFLRHVVERTLDGDTASLKENLLGVDVFERGARFDPRIHPVVRVEARRLRAKLDDYYAAEGRTDPVVVQLPKGAYVPLFARQSEPLSEPLPEATPPPAAPVPRLGLASSGGPAPGIGTPKLARPRRWWPAAVAGVAVLAAAAVAFIWSRQPAAPSGQVSVAVLPFVNVGAGQDTEYFADGLTDELIDTLSRSKGLRVVARSSVFQFKGRTGDARGIATQLNADMLVEGSVRSDASRLRVTAQLVDARNGFEIWSQTFDREWKQVFAMQQEIAAAIASKLRVQLAGDRRVRYTDNLACYNLYLKGRYYWNKRTIAGFRAAIAAFREALEKDPNFAPAWAGLSDSYSMLGFLDAERPHDIRPKAEEAALKALALDDTLAEAHVALANVRAVYDWDWERAERSYRRAIELEPGSASGHYGLSKLLASIGRISEAIPEIRLAQERDPLSLIIASSVGWELAVARRYEESDRAFQAAFDLDPSFIWGYTLHAFSHEARGEYAQAVESLRKAVSLSA